MPSVTVRHLTEADLPLRTRLLKETSFQANLSDFAVLVSDEALHAIQYRAITEEHSVKRMFTLCAAHGEVVGFAWITSVDWRAQSCEISFGILDEYRGLYGAAAVEAAHTFLRSELNIQVTVNQVLEHNTMMHSAERLASQRQVRTVYDSFTLGEWRTSCYWSENDDDVRALQSQAVRRRQELADRIRARTGQDA